MKQSHILAALDETEKMKNQMKEKVMDLGLTDAISASEMDIFLTMKMKYVKTMRRTHQHIKQFEDDGYGFSKDGTSVIYRFHWCNKSEFLINNVTVWINPI